MNRGIDVGSTTSLALPWRAGVTLLLLPFVHLALPLTLLSNDEQGPGFGVVVGLTVAFIAVLAGVWFGSARRSPLIRTRLTAAAGLLIAVLPLDVLAVLLWRGELALNEDESVAFLVAVAAWLAGQVGLLAAWLRIELRVRRGQLPRANAGPHPAMVLTAVLLLAANGPILFGAGVQQ